MAKNQANSSQIKENAILSRHIKAGEVDGTHLKDAAIESKHLAAGSVTDEHLAIDWGAKASTILQSKLVVDYVQTQAVTVNASATSIVATSAITATVATDAIAKGVVVESGKNSVIIRTATDVTEPFRDTDGEEVKGRVTHDGTDFTVSFHTVKAGVEVPFEFAEEVSIVFQYPQRFDFESVSEMFGANEKFVDYGVDTSTRFDINQLVADVFGDTYDLNGDGLAVNAGVTLAGRIDEIEDSIFALEASVSDTTTAAGSALEKSTALEKSLDTLTEDVTAHAIEIGAVKTNVEELQELVESLENKPDTQLPGIQRYDKAIIAADLEASEVVFIIDASVGKEPVSGDFDVYLNGMLQMAGLHYAESRLVEEKVMEITFAPESLVENDVVQVRWLA